MQGARDVNATPLYFLQSVCLLAALLYSFPVHSQGSCASKSCFTCENSPANCTLNDTTSTVRCSGDTSECTVTQCASGTHCVALYYKANINLTDFLFSSSCFSIDVSFNCDSTPATCVASGSVGSRELLFDTSGISCTCYSDNCTWSISYNYTVDPLLLPPKSSSQSPLATNPLPTNVPATIPRGIIAVIVVLAALFFALSITAVALAVCVCVKHLHSKTPSSSSSPSSSSRGPQTSTFSHMVPADPLSLNSSTCSSSHLPSSSSSSFSPPSFA
eukprot:Em0007g651a